MQQINSPLNKPTFFKKFRYFFYIGIPALVIGIGAYAWFVNKDILPINQNVNNSKKEDPIVYYSLLNGAVVSKTAVNSHPVAVMIENSKAARPQAGLIDADIVYEAVTEGGITRFMGIFSSSYPAKSGPVRSARSYFIDWLSDYDAFYAHAGGSPKALARIREYKIKDYPHSSDTYWREPKAGVAIEHTLFANIANIYKYGVQKKKWPATYETKSWIFKDPATGSDAAGDITIDFSKSSSFKVVWKFDATTNTYSRIMAGIAHKDRTTGKQLSAVTIVAMRVTHSANAPYAGSGKESEWNMTTIGSGKASVFIDGKEIKGTWKKPSRLERLRFYDETDKEITLNRGKIWIEVVPQEGTYSQALLTPATTPTN
ncbi:DUF3048 domain-containing protein [Candidatus Berkelbacteria bacterium]|nr:DUF3048 domain-containing protein [Candidatus Berkelbacteria bacterium]